MYDHFELANLVMVYLLGVTLASVRLGRGPAVLTAVANVLAFDFCFVPPRFSFAVSDVEYLVTFAVMLVVALIIANLMASVRQQTRVAGARERRTALLYAMSRELGATRGTADMARVAVRHVAEVFGCEAVVLLPDAQGRLRYPADAPMPGSLRGADLSVAQWVLDHAERAGLGADTLPAAPALYLPLGDSRPARGVLAVLPANRRRVLLPEQRHLLDTFAGQIGLALERAQLAEGRRGGPGRHGNRGPAQHAARVDLPRPAHPARRHGRGRQRAGGARCHARSCHPRVARALGGAQGPRDVRADLQRAGADPPRVRPAAAPAELGGAR